jgi:hypothetical protein
MARIVGLDFVYTYPYRLASQSDVHATPTAVDRSYEDAGERGQRLRKVPRYALEGYDGYQVGAHLLLDIIRPLAERVPELGWRETTDAIAQQLTAVWEQEAPA